MKNLIIIGLSAASLLALPAAAQPRPNDQNGPGDQRGPQQGAQTPPVRKPVARKPAPQRPAPQRPTAGPYGQWNAGWGARPPAPPKHWTRKSDWNRHVRACQVRYRSYNPRTDTYVLGKGLIKRCTL